MKALQQKEAAAAAVAKTANRITLDQIEALVVREVYFTGEELENYAGAEIVMNYPTDDDAWRAEFVQPSFNALTVCVLQLRNGFSLVGHSAPVDPENFDPHLGRSIARQNALGQVWALEDYVLRRRMYEAKLGAAAVQEMIDNGDDSKDV